jgi:hypothetical protein
MTDLREGKRMAKRQLATKGPDITTAPVQPVYRIRFLIDEMGYFEESNGESRPLTEEEYAKGPYQHCPDHPRAGSKVVIAAGQQIAGCAVCERPGAAYVDVPYDEYLAYYGNPDRHVYVQCDVERQCPCCHHFEYATGLGHIDFMEDAPELRALDKTYTELEIDRIPGYLQEVARNCVADAKAEAAQAAHA